MKGEKDTKAQDPISVAVKRGNNEIWMAITAFRISSLFLACWCGSVPDPIQYWRHLSRALGVGTCSCLLSVRTTLLHQWFPVQRVTTCTSNALSGLNLRPTKISIHSENDHSYFLWNSCIILSPTSDWMGGRAQGKGKRKRKRLPLTSCLCLGVCVCFVFLYRSQHVLLKSQTNLWLGCCEWSLPPAVLWKQTQAQGQVLLLFQKFFPTSSILPLALISMALLATYLSLIENCSTITFL